MRRIMLGAVVGVVALAAMTAGTTRPAVADDATVTITGFSFDPSTITVGNHGAVIWTNADPVFHTVTSVDGLWDSDPLGRGDTFTLDVSTLAPGTYRYFCRIHQDMQGTLVIDDALG